MLKINKNISSSLFIFSVFCFNSLVFISCYRCSCHCEYKSGCTTIIATNLSGDTLIKKKTFCAQDNFINDKAVADSVANFYHLFGGTNVKITFSDSTWNFKQKTHLTCKEADKLKNYDCTCAK